MSMPNIPPKMCTDINIDRKSLIDLLLMSIALEELSLAHIVNAEGELLQLYAQQLTSGKTVDKNELMKISRSVADILRLVLEKEQSLKEKLRYVIQFHDENF